MNMAQKNIQRIEEWHEDLNEMKIHGSLLAWHKTLLSELCTMSKENLLSTEETLVFRKLAIDRYCTLANITLLQYINL